MPPKLPNDETQNPVDTVAIITDAFRAKFGADAVAAAERQRELASDEIVARWEEVLVRLRGQEDRSE